MPASPQVIDKVDKKSDEETGPAEGQLQIPSPKGSIQQPDEDFADLLLESKRMLFDLKVMEDSRGDAIKDIRKPEAMVFEDVDGSTSPHA